MLSAGRRSVARVLQLQVRALGVAKEVLGVPPSQKKSKFAPNDESDYTVWTEANPNFKVSTMMTGMEVVPFCRDVLLEAYQATLKLLAKLPESGYRRRTEQLTAARMAICLVTENDKEIERAVDAGIIEELLEQAHDEHQLALYMQTQFERRTDPSVTQNPTLFVSRQGKNDTDVAPFDEAFQSQQVDWQRELELNDAQTNMPSVEEVLQEYSTLETPTKRMMREYRVLNGYEEHEIVNWWEMDHEWRTAWYQRRFADNFKSVPRVADIYEPS
ncbi:MAG: hypothetical protein MHM6MM_007158 [Cercozoa sp. M6MM]